MNTATPTAPATLSATEIGKELTAALELDITVEQFSNILDELGFDDAEHANCLVTALQEEGNEKWVGQQIRELITTGKIDGEALLAKIRAYDEVPA